MALKMPQHYKCYNILSSLPRNLGLYNLTEKLDKHHNSPVSKKIFKGCYLCFIQKPSKKA